MAASIPNRVGSLLLACALMATPLTGCTTIRQIPMDPGIPEAETAAAQESGQRITGYTSADGVRHAFDGWVRLVGSDSLHFRPAPPKSPIWFPPGDRVPPADSLQSAFELPRTQVASVQARQGSAGKSLLLAGCILAGAFGIVAALVAIGGGVGVNME
jgi:hypothetical protein